jgi:hypothetical protein
MNKEILLALVKTCGATQSSVAWLYWDTDVEAVVSAYRADSTIVRSYGSFGWSMRDRGAPDSTFAKKWFEWIRAEWV